MTNNEDHGIIDETPPLKCIVSLGHLSHPGRKHLSNQDLFCALVGPDAPCNSDVLLAVADGIGGHKAGEVASEMAIRGLITLMTSHSSAIALSDGIPCRLKQTFLELNGQIHAAASLPASQGMGTTLTAAVISGNTLTISHVGDCRAYLLREGEIRQLTKDHNWATKLKDEGLADCALTETGWGRNLLTRALGPRPEVDIECVEAKIKEDDVVLVCSDGVHSLIADDELVQILAGNDPQSSSQEIINLANAKGGSDDITAVVCQIRGFIPRFIQDET